MVLLQPAKSPMCASARSRWVC